VLVSHHRRLAQQLVLVVGQQPRNLRGQAVERDGLLGVAGAPGDHGLAGGEVPRPQFYPQRDPAQLVIGDPAPQRDVRVVVELGPDRLDAEGVNQGPGGLGHPLAGAGHEYYDLRRGKPRRDAQPTVVSVDHDHRAEQPRRDPPGGLPDVAQLAVAIGEPDVKRPGEVLAQLVRGPHLQRLAVAHQPLARP
jgi:hypothetical protein